VLTRHWNASRLGAILCGAALGCAAGLAQTAPKSTFTTDVAPLLTRKCLECHGQVASMSNLDLRTREGALKGGQHGAAITPGDAAASRLYRHLTGQQQPQMPLGGRLTDQEIATVKAWIDGGAGWDNGVTLVAPAKPAATSENTFTDQQRRYWAFQKVVKSSVPPVKNRGWAHNPVDAFVLAKLEGKGLRPNPPADKITLIRRAYFDLIGLPPSPEEVQAFLADRSPNAFTKVVDSLLASPRYGERWGRHWLDLARYADTAGFKGDETRPNMWRYRDYVIQSFNDDKPYDRFIKEQIAGDELYPDDSASLIATGLNRLWPDESNLANPMLRRQEILNDITDTVGSVFMGLTYGCARCHDHKFDPILHKDYYRLQAFFAASFNEDRARLLEGPKRDEFRRQYAAWDITTRDIRAKMDAILSPLRLEATSKRLSNYPKEAQEAVLTPAEQRNPMQWQMYLRSRSRLPSAAALEKTLKGEEKQRYAELKQQLANFDHIKPAEPPVAEAMVDNGHVAPPTFVLAKGVWDAPLAEVQPGFLTILDPNPPSIVPPEGVNSTGRRSALAKWLANPANPLTARVMVNRIWQYHFGRGVTASSSDFGVMGDRPTNPQLLDYLAATFVENGWSIKKMHRLIMLSNAYQQSSAYREEAAQIDPDNKLGWRFDRRRLEGEVIRDSILHVSGQLSSKMGGPGIFAPLPKGISMPGSKYLNWDSAKDATEANRRSVYLFVKRNLPYPMFETFDFPDTSESCARRYSTVNPAQPLAMMNDEMILDWARVLAGRILNDAGLSPQQQVERAYRLVLNRAPKVEESNAVLAFLDWHSGIISRRLERNEKVAMPDRVPEGMPPARSAAFVDFCHTLVNSNEFVYMN